jgi:hypothetical protein
MVLKVFEMFVGYGWEINVVSLILKQMFREVV